MYNLIAKVKGIVSLEFNMFIMWCIELTTRANEKIFTRRVCSIVAVLALLAR